MGFGNLESIDVVDLMTQETQAENQESTPVTPTFGDLTTRFAKLKSKADRGVHGAVEVALELKELKTTWDSLPLDQKPTKPLTYWVVTHLSPKGLAWFIDLAEAALALEKARWQMLHPDAIKWVHRHVESSLRTKYFEEVSSKYTGFNKQTPLSKTQAQSAYDRILRTLAKGAH